MGDDAAAQERRKRERLIERACERVKGSCGRALAFASKPSLGLWGSVCTDFQVLLARGTVRTCFVSRSEKRLHETR